MTSSAVAPVLIAVLWQSGWALTQSPPREVRRLYWELVPEMEIWVRLVPEAPEGNAPLINLVFHAFYPGRAERDPYTGLPAWPRGAPTRLAVSAEPLPTTLIRELSLRLKIDGQTVDLTGPESRYRNLPCLTASEDCVPNAVEAEISAPTLRSLAGAGSIEGRALGFPIKLVAADQLALKSFVARIGLSEDNPKADRGHRVRVPGAGATGSGTSRFDQYFRGWRPFGRCHWNAAADQLTSVRGFSTAC
jgi:hypothetical protein